MGVTAHWIDVKDGKWNLHAEVVAFQGLSGNHGGKNMGKYLLGMLDHVGITGPHDSKACSLFTS